MSALKTNKRLLIWLPLLGIAFWLGLFADKTPNDQMSAPKSPRSAAHQLSTPTVTSSTIAKTDSASLETLVDRAKFIGSEESKLPKWRNLFASGSWTPAMPPSKLSTQITAMATTAPTFPFQYVGKKLEESIWEVYLSRGDQSFLVREGGTLEGTYRIDSITAQRLTVTYLPLGQSQSLSIGESQ